MPMFTPEKALRSMRKTPVILKAILQGVSAEQAQSIRDGEGGWSVVEVVGHLYDFEDIFCGRAGRMLTEAKPILTPYDQDELVKRRGYASQDLATVLDKYLEMRQRFINLLADLTSEQWARKGVHPHSGEITVMELAINTTLHDVNHTEQIAHMLE